MANAIDDKLDYLEETKALIKAQLIAKGGVIDENTTFREYAEVIENLSTGASEEWLDEVLAIINRINGTDVGDVVVIPKQEYDALVDALEQAEADAEEILS